MSNFERDIGVERGPRFYRDDGELMFAFGIDPSNSIGPRQATKIDQERWPEAWAAFLVGDAPKPRSKRQPRAEVKHEPADDHSEDS